MEQNLQWEDIADRRSVKGWLSWLDSERYPIPEGSHLSTEALLSLASDGATAPLSDDCLEHLASCARCVSTLRALQSKPHIDPQDIWRLAAGKPEKGDPPFWQEHLASCERCSRALKEAELDQTTGRETLDQLNPADYHLAAPGERPESISHVTDNRYYRVTFQRRGERDEDLLTLEVTDAIRSAVEGKRVVVLDPNLRVVAHGRISGGTLLRSVPPETRLSPLRIQVLEEAS